MQLRMRISQHYLKAGVVRTAFAYDIGFPHPAKYAPAR
jgi:hypothetical protein